MLESLEQFLYILALNAKQNGAVINVAEAVALTVDQLTTGIMMMWQ